MNWGYKIMTVIILFVLGMCTMVTIAMKQTNEMIDDQYYNKELNHQKLLDASNNLNSKNGSVVISQDSDYIKFSFPKNVTEKIDEGNITFLRPSDKSKDFILPLTLDSKNDQIILRNKFVTGSYMVSIKWKNDGSEYYDEQTVFIK